MERREIEGGQSRPGIAASVLLAVLRAYQIFLSPLLGPRCRFEPSCSSYAAQAIAKWGVVRGGFLAIKRVFRCHPLHDGGLDPVP